MRFKGGTFGWLQIVWVGGSQFQLSQQGYANITGFDSFILDIDPAGGLVNSSTPGISGSAPDTRTMSIQPKQQ